MGTDAVNQTIDVGGPGAPAGPARDALKALAADLPFQLDAHLKRLVESALRRSRKTGLKADHLLSAFTTGRHSEEQFSSVLGALDTTEDGPTARAQLSAWMLGIATLTPDERRIAARYLRSIVQSTPSRHRRPLGERMGHAAILSVLIALPMGLLVSLPLWWQAAPAFEILVYVALLAVLFACVVLLPALGLVGMADSRAANDLRFLSTHALGRLGDPEGVDALAAAAMDADRQIQRMGWIALWVLLPTLAPDDYGRLGAQGVPNLCRLLNSDRSLGVRFGRADFNTRIELLLAIEKVGDARAIPAVRQARHALGASVEFVTIADRVLGVLEERKRRETERATLLRGAEQPAIADGELLRPSIKYAEIQPEQLLRPTDNG
jgi:hypothetical protein